MAELTAGSHYSIDMVISDSIDTVACSLLNEEGGESPASLNKSTHGVNHVVLVCDQKGKKEESRKNMRRRWRHARG